MKIFTCTAFMQQFILIYCSYTTQPELASSFLLVVSHEFFIFLSLIVVVVAFFLLLLMNTHPPTTAHALHVETEERRTSRQNCAARGHRSWQPSISIHDACEALLSSANNSGRDAGGAVSWTSCRSARSNAHSPSLHIYNRRDQNQQNRG